MRILDQATAARMVFDEPATQSGCGSRCPKVLVIVKGEAPEIAEFVTRLRPAVEKVDWRELVWIRDPLRFSKGVPDWWFRGGEGEDACAVILGPEREPVGTLAADSSQYDIDIALLDAMWRRTMVGKPVSLSKE
jgi:hypothetical protein